MNIGKFGSNGKRLARFGQKKFFYQDNGLLDSISDVYSNGYGYEWKFSKDMKSADMICHDADGRLDWKSQSYVYTYNRVGCLSSISNNLKETNIDIATGKTTCTYDKNGHLQSLDTPKGLYILTWVNDTITDIIETKDKTGSTYSRKLHFDYNKGELPNASRQYPTILDRWDYPIYFHLGLFGDGPAFLPLNVTCDMNNNSPWKAQCEYTLNNDGTIAKCRWLSTVVMTYTYK